MPGCAGTPRAEPSRSPHPTVRATSTSCCARGRQPVSDAGEFATRDPANADGFSVADAPPDPLNGLVERAKDDPGLPFKSDMLTALVELRRTDRATFETLRGRLRRVGVRVTVLDAAM